MHKEYYQKVYAPRHWCVLLFAFGCYTAEKMMDARNFEYAAACAGNEVKRAIEI